MKDNILIGNTLEALDKSITLINTYHNKIENPLYYVLALATIKNILKKLKDCDATSATKCFTCINQINRGDLL